MVNLFQGDCLELMKQIPDGSVDLVLCDPPYEICTTGAGMYKKSDKKYIKSLKPMSSGFSTDVLDEMCRVTKQVNVYFFCSQKQIIPLIDYFVKDKKCNWNILSWHKTNPIPACGNKYLTDTEFILFFRQKGVKVYGNFETKKTWYATPLNVREKHKYNHPTVKPVNIIKNLILNSSRCGDLVLDPFMGSGSTGVACVNTGRDFIGIELDEKYFETAKQRIEKAEKEVSNNEFKISD